MIKLTALVSIVLFTIGGVGTAQASDTEVRPVSAVAANITADGGIQVGSGDIGR